MTARLRLTGHGRAGAITVHSMGGLGNQLFIYAGGLAAARNAGCRLRIDTSLHRLDANRPFQLDALGLPAEYVDLGLAEANGRIRRRLVGAPHRCSYREPSFRFDRSALGQPDGACLYGYFQGHQYVDQVGSELREFLNGVRDSRRGTAAYESIRSQVTQPGAIVLHVRRGDYLREQTREFHGLAGLDYYRRAVDILRRMGFTGPLVLFTDDVERTIPEFEPLGDVSSPSAMGTLDAIDEMLLMSESQAMVTANSSFSWWAAWLGHRSERPVICPRPWFSEPSLDERDLLLPGWLTLHR